MVSQLLEANPASLLPRPRQETRNDPIAAHVVAQAGYSGTPLIKKLGIKDGLRVLVVNPPDNYWQLLGVLPPNVRVAQENEEVDFIHYFGRYLSTLEADFVRLKDKLERNGSFWISWPKGTSNLDTDLNREVIREFVLHSEFVNIKVCAIDEDWSGLKFVVRKELRQPLNS